jgi:hypothetical protein
MSGNLAARRRPALRRAWHRWTRAAAAVCAGLALVAIGSAAAPTSAAWVNPAYFTTSASSGSWIAPNTCQVRNSDGTVDTTKPCVVTMSNGGTFWPTPPTEGNFSFSVSSAIQPGTSQYFTFSVTLSKAPSTGWTAGHWVTTGLNNNAQLTSSCAALPMMTGRTQPNLGSSPNVGGPLLLNPPTGTATSCNS